MQDFRNLAVWQAARELTGRVYRSTQAFPVEETFGLRAQMRKAAVPICANIAEGCGRRGDAEFARFLGIAIGSASELECETVLAADLELLSASDHDRLTTAIVEVKRMLAGLLGVVRRK